MDDARQVFISFGGGGKEKTMTSHYAVKAKACSNIAVVKYWGKRDEKLAIPANPSVSLTLDALRTTTEVSFEKELKRDEITIDGLKIPHDSPTYIRVSGFLDRVRLLSGKHVHAKVVSENNFPKSSGLASSASGFAALALAASKAAGLDLARKELSILARLGSGSACRSVFDGWVEWVAGRENASRSSYARRIAPAEMLKVHDVIAVINSGEKKTSSRKGMLISRKTSPLFWSRARAARTDAVLAKKAIRSGNFEELGMIAEKECALMHAVMLSSAPPLRYLDPKTLLLCDSIVRAREEDGLPAYFTIDAGANVHVLTLPQFSKRVHRLIRGLNVAESIIESGPGPEAEVISEGGNNA